VGTESLPWEDTLLESSFLVKVKEPRIYTLYIENILNSFLYFKAAIIFLLSSSHLFHYNNSSIFALNENI
jgi:hypothetical protein